MNFSSRNCCAICLSWSLDKLFWYFYDAISSNQCFVNDKIILWCGRTYSAFLYGGNSLHGHNFLKFYLVLCLIGFSWNELGRRYCKKKWFYAQFFKWLKAAKRGGSFKIQIEHIQTYKITNFRNFWKTFHVTICFSPTRHYGKFHEYV